MEAEEVWRRFGADVAAGLLPVLEKYQPDLLLLGGQIAKSFPGLERTGKRVREKKDSDSDRNGNIRPCHGRPVVTVS